MIKLSEVVIGPKTRSLVAIPMPVSREAEVPANANYSKFDPKSRGVEIVLGILDKAVVSVLAANPSRAWTDKDLAIAVSMQPEVEADDKTLCNRWLPLLRGSKTTQAHHCYNALAPRGQPKWRHAPTSSAPAG